MVSRLLYPAARTFKSVHPAQRLLRAAASVLVSFRFAFSGFRIEIGTRFVMGGYIFGFEAEPKD